MAIPTDKAYTRGHELQGDGSVHFACSTDRAQWPWLALPPHHPVPMQTQNFWTSVECSTFLGGFDPEKWSALVWTDWETGVPDVGHAVRGSFSNSAEGQERGFTTTLFDADDRMIARMRGRGVVFRTRNFESWREGSKSEARVAEDHGEFAHASREALGLSEGEMPFVSPLRHGDTARALVTRDNGFMPGNRYVGGSGDHVNSTHIAEISRQFLALLLGRAPFRLTGGEMALNRYIELGTPLDLACTGHSGAEARVTLSQLGRSCSQVVLRYAKR